MLIGSNVFFKNIQGFKSKDVDILELVDNPTNFKLCRHFKFPSKCVFQWKRMTSSEFIDVTLKRNLPMEIGKFLVPEFIQEFSITIEDLKRLQPLIDNMDEKHLYEKIIYDAYIKNNAFFITDEQLMEAYKIYLKYRNHGNKN